jgi:hypothetical protein
LTEQNGYCHQPEYVDRAINEAKKQWNTRQPLKLALNALESSDALINGEGNLMGLDGAIDGYYSGCFDVDGNNKILREAIAAIKNVLAES